MIANQVRRAATRAGGGGVVFQDLFVGASGDFTSARVPDIGAYKATMTGALLGDGDFANPLGTLARYVRVERDTSKEYRQTFNFKASADVTSGQVRNGFSAAVPGDQASSVIWGFKMIGATCGIYLDNVLTGTDHNGWCQAASVDYKIVLEYYQNGDLFVIIDDVLEFSANSTKYLSNTTGQGFALDPGNTGSRLQRCHDYTVEEI